MRAASTFALFGGGVDRIFAGRVTFCLPSVISTMILAGPRVYYAMARDRHLKSLYRTFGYLITSLFFILFNLWMIVFCIKENPMVALYNAGTIVLGVVAFFCFDIKNKGPEEGLPIRFRLDKGE